MIGLTFYLQNYWWCIIALAAFSYILGSVNFAVVFTRLVKKQDIRTLGSGNAGFTNVLRCVGVFPAVMTFVFDFLKAVISVLAARLLVSYMPVEGMLSQSSLKTEYMYYTMLIAGLFCVIGHSFPVFFNFKGGKGVVTTAAMMAVVDWRFFLFVLGTFLVVFVFSRIISLSSIIAGIMMGPSNFVVTYFFMYKPSLDTVDPYSITFVWVTTILAACIGLFAIIKHKDNIKRILKGEEKKITAKKKEA
ncbi:MAG: glycerol-3-phosphate 1-O-acyltransferase PlsY [Ruminococcus sp.]|nr:glycerol-3-phosphate 1-O-acyltransferase PlsY [Ruminococcus sp.]MDO4419378.1 glycerol-3-phosphate 1-O-acyltransferase PlsY [Ruminococcus sp.]